MSDIESDPVPEPEVVAEAPVDEPVDEPVGEAATDDAGSTTARTAADGYAFAAVTCAAAGLIVPIGISLIGGRRGFVSFAIVLLSAPAALLLARATEEPIATEPVSPGVARIAGIAQTLAYASLALVVTFCAALLLGILARVITG